MTAQQLKNSILQLAVQGKLVPQDPNDEPASVLLERIRTEKQQLIKEKKIKPEKNPSYIFRGTDNTPYEKIGNSEPVSIADQVPFEIPDSWEWVRLGNILLKLSDGTHSTPSYQQNGIPFISVKDISNGKLDFSKCKYISKSEHEELYNRCNPEKGDLLLTKVGTTGIPIIVDTDEQFSLFVSVALLKFNQESIYNKFLLYEILAPIVQQQAEENTRGVGNKNWVMRDIANTLIVIPPIAEQYRIVAKIEELLPYVEKYKQAETQIAALNTTFPELLKKTILQEAVMGKLVPQDPDDEPASVLLDRIKAEKQELIKQGKIKPDKHESVIFKRDNSHYERIGNIERCIDDELPFEIPDSWEWCRASYIGTMLRGKGIKRNETVKEGTPCVRYGEIYTTYNYSFAQTVSFIPAEIDSKCIHFGYGDILFTLTGENKVDIAKAVTYLGKSTVAAGGDLAIWTTHGMNPMFLVYFMASPYCIDQKQNTSTGDIIVHISTSKVGHFLVPIPPLAEQHSIVAKIEELMKYCKML